MDEAGIAMVQFSVFGTEANAPWYRLSVGACKVEEIPEVLASLKAALGKLS
jgi:aspartate aminotransferase